MRSMAIIYYSHYGQTHRIAQYIREKAEVERIAVQIQKLTDEDGLRPRQSLVDPLANAEAVMVGGPIYRGHFPSPLIQWMRRHRDQLRTKRRAYFSVGLNAVDRRPEMRAMDDAILRSLITEVGLVPHFVASLCGALNYLDYGWVLKQIMKSKIRQAGGPTDTNWNYQFTDWNQVDSFVQAFLQQDKKSPFATPNRFPRDISMDHLMPEFEQCWKREIEIQGLPLEVYDSLQRTGLNDIFLANVLANPRNLSGLGIKTRETRSKSFLESAEKLGVVPLKMDPPRELLNGFIGKFREFRFGIVRVPGEKFGPFTGPGYTKVLASFRINRVPHSRNSRLCCELRIHSNDILAARKFRLYWTLFGPGIKLYMTGLLRAIKFHAESSGQRQSGEVPV